MDLTRRSAILAAMVSALTRPARAEVKPFVLSVGHVS
jgi:hypothetical protein